MGLDFSIRRKLKDGSFEWVDEQEMETPLLGNYSWATGRFRNAGSWNRGLKFISDLFDESNDPFCLFNNDWGPYEQQPDDWYSVLCGLKLAQQRIAHALPEHYMLEPIPPEEIDEIQCALWNLRCMVTTVEWVVKQPDPENYYTWFN